MKRLTTVLCTLVLLVFAVPFASANGITFYDWVFYVDGTTYENFAGDPIPGDITSFDTSTGLGTIEFTFNAPGSHNVIAFFDFEIDEATNTYFNEYGDAIGSPASDQSWEIDEPGYFFGDIYDNVISGSLDNTNSVPNTDPDDVSMALGWNFNVPIGETWNVIFKTSLYAPTSGFYLKHTDPASGIKIDVPGAAPIIIDPAAIYFSSTLDTGGAPPIPEPGTWILMLTGLALTGGVAAKRSKRK
ncbi:MAG: PEP-CTERM sorting domain-containing protein [Sedimentisphaerales bacterium]|nr:PEP-CTERM sorting domain-containing protein [Sedimentisphaerales bacterium]